MSAAQSICTGWAAAGTLLVAALLTTGASAQTKSRVSTDLEYARVGDVSLRLDVHRPVDGERMPVVVWVHGGAWRSGSKKDVPIAPLTEHGFAVASVDYRLSPVARFPAQIHDLKAAIRFLRARADELAISTERMAIAGASAGGHLAALVGVTSGHKELEGTVGEHASQSSAVQAIIDLYGPTNLTTILAQSTPHGLSVRVPALELLFGGQPDAKRDLAALASPVLHVDAADPPLLILHGDQDPQVPINQSHELVGAYKRHGLPATFDVVYGAAHGGKEFFTPERIEQMAEFLRPVLRPTATAAAPAK